MLQHPWILLWITIKQQGRTQKQFAILAWKKVSEVNELIKGKRNITIQRDYLLHKVLGTPLKYRIILQIEFDYQNFIKAFSLPASEEILPEQAKTPPEQAEILPEETEKTPPSFDDLLKEKEYIFKNF